MNKPGNEAFNAHPGTVLLPPIYQSVGGKDVAVSSEEHRLKFYCRVGFELSEHQGQRIKG